MDGPTNKRIEVTAAPGRVVRESPRGAFIPDDRYVSVVETFYIWRLIHVHGDLKVKPVEKVSAPPPPSEKRNKEEKA